MESKTEELKLLLNSAGMSKTSRPVTRESKTEELKLSSSTVPQDLQTNSPSESKTEELKHPAFTSRVTGVPRDESKTEELKLSRSSVAILALWTSSHESETEELKSLVNQCGTTRS